MADVIISAIIGDVVSRAVSLLIGRFSNNQESTGDKLQRLRHLLIRIHSVVEEAKGRQISNHGTLQWLSELINGEYQGCYLLDSVGCGAGQQEVDRDDDDDDDKVPQVSTLSLFNPAKRVRVAAGCTVRLHHDDIDISVVEIERVLERLKGMSHDLREFILLLQSCKPVRRPLPTSIYRDGQMFGRHVEKQRIINFLLHEDDDQATAELSVLPIVGGNGVGKTTLVQYACDDPRVRSHFPMIMLYNFSSTYDVKKNEGTCSDDPLELVNNGNTYREEQKRCLVIFEDVDIHRMQILEEFLHRSRCSKVGIIKMIITTNNRHVANIVGTVEPIKLRALPCPEYWFFFKAHAFAGRDVEDNPRLISTGKAIAKKLNGSFFGAKIVGGVLRDQPDPRLWCQVLRSSISPSLGDGISYISDMADSLLPGHVDMCKVTLTKDPSFPSQTTQQLALFKDLHGAVPHDSTLACWADDVRFAKVLLCKSVLPFFNHYYIACCSCTCTVGSENPHSKLVLSRA